MTTQSERQFVKREHPVKAIQFDHMNPTPGYEFLRRRDYETRYMSGSTTGFYFSHRYRGGEKIARSGDWLVDEGMVVVAYPDSVFRERFGPFDLPPAATGPIIGEGALDG